MPLTIAERKHLLPRGAQKEVASELGMKKSYVSAVMNGVIRPKTEGGRRRLRTAQVALARKLGRRVDDVFPHEVHEVAPPLAAAS